MTGIRALTQRFDWMRDSGVCSPTTRGLLDDAQAALEAQEAKITALQALADEHWDWKAGRTLADRLRRILSDDSQSEQEPCDPDEWEYGYELIEQDTGDVLTRGWPYDTQEEAARRAVVRAEEESDPDALPLIGRAIRRRKPDPWEPVKTRFQQPALPWGGDSA